MQHLLATRAIQPKLDVNKPDDKFEREADQVADQVRRMPDPSATNPQEIDSADGIPKIQRLCPECEKSKHRNEVPAIQRMCSECQEELQRKPLDSCREASNLTPNLEPQLNGTHSGGMPLSKADRAFFEPRFGCDFHDVRVHTDARAAEAARLINAQAYTTGRHIVFGQGQYAPESSTGKRLLAHELVHTVQQGATNYIMRQGGGAGPVGLPSAIFTDFLTTGAVRCCRDRGRGQCPPHLGVAVPGDPKPQNGMNLVATITDHRPGVEYGFVQVIHFSRCIRFAASLGGGWAQVDSGGPGKDDSPVPDATCTIPNARNEIVMTDAPGFDVLLGGPAWANTEEVTVRVNATNWVIARQKPGEWQRISELFQWHSVTGFRRNAAGNFELTPGGNRIGPGSTRIGSCPPPSP